MEIFLATINFLSIFFLTFFIGSKKTYKNIILSALMTVFIVLEMLSFMYLGYEIKEEFMFFLTNIQVFHLTLATKLFVIYYTILISIFIFILLYYILEKFQIQKYRKLCIVLCLSALISPIGFIYKIFYVFTVNYTRDYLLYKNTSYQDIFREIKNMDYVEKNELKILNSDEKYKNIVWIYLESYEQSYLTNDKIKEYTKDINNLSKQGEFYKNISQINGTMGTLAGIFSSQCGIKYLSFFLLKNPYSQENKNNKLVCLPDVLKKAGYKQVFLGGADKYLFNKGNYLFSHGYDIVEDVGSLTSKYPELNNQVLSWGVADYDVFNIAKKEYKELSKSQKPFNLTILTTSTHTPNGVYDERCKNSTKNGLLNGIECTNNLVKDFIDFLKKQPNYKNTLVIIMPDHRQYDINRLNKIISFNEKLLYVIMLNSGKIATYDKTIYYTDLPEIILEKLNIKSNATFFGTQYDIPSKNFIYKIHLDKN